MAKRKVYLAKKSLEEAKAIWNNFLSTIEPKKETIPVKESLNRITASPVQASRSAPNFNASAMDGIAVSSEDTAGATEREPITLKGNQFKYVNTGNLIPEGYNAVIKIEDINQLDSGIKIFKSVSPWHNVRTIGESVMKGDQILTSNQKLKAYHIGALLEAGVFEVEVYAKPVLTVISTGDEIVSPESSPEPGQYVDFNSTMVKEMAEEAGGEINFYGVVSDEEKALKAAINQATQSSDLVITIAGSSAGSKDFTASIVEEKGEIFVHGVEIQPGKPLLLGAIENVPFIGLPGFPLSCLHAFENFGTMAVKALQKDSADADNYIQAKVKRKLASKPGRVEYVRVNLSFEKSQTGQEDFPIAVPRRRGSAVMKSQAQADGILEIPADREGLAVDELAEVKLLYPESCLKDNLVLAGSNDPLLDYLQELLITSAQKIKLRLQSRGSQAGIHALIRGEADLTTAHLLDPETGEYNLSYLDQIAEEPLELLTLAWRDQGLYLSPDSQLCLKNINDLKNKDITFINRQQGAGTRILFDYQLNQSNIKPAEIKGYDREEYTHAAVAQAVAVGSADTALGIRAVAKAFGLNFIPLFSERFELIYPTRLAEDYRIKKIKEIIKSNRFQEYLTEQTGYDLKDTGQIRNAGPSRRR
ncbi:molybdopterin biosynthesis protein [Halanaerobiaceae bacterium Z-7014]|uniref:Molybdopterin molybdenumtransferase n=1 Tax=Halonatronomonas betaini TaxID=2778430 RepID=A0A931AQG0_9FIRM|nr:molybdopterin biosynthesis protein [Halonatronomonas betaini]MBF8435936.1 molybdopterin biosynthesis protein [Halonatronomonas betaini]